MRRKSFPLPSTIPPDDGKFACAICSPANSKRSHSRFSDMFRWLAISLSLGAALAADSAPTLPNVIDKVRAAYRSADAMLVMRDVYASDRYFTFPRFHATAEYLK